MDQDYDKRPGMEGMWPKKFKKEFKMAMLNKKEKILEAKLEFVREMKALVEKMAAEMKDDE